MPDQLPVRTVNGSAEAKGVHLKLLEMFQQILVGIDAVGHVHHHGYFGRGYFPDMPQELFFTVVEGGNENDGFNDDHTDKHPESDPSGQPALGKLKEPFNIDRHDRNLRWRISTSLLMLIYYMHE